MAHKYQDKMDRRNGHLTHDKLVAAWWNKAALYDIDLPIVRNFKPISFLHQAGFVPAFSHQQFQFQLGNEDKQTK